MLFRRTLIVQNQCILVLYIQSCSQKKLCDSSDSFAVTYIANLQNIKMSGCCPPNSLGALNNSHYTSKGIVEHIDATNIDLYCVGKSEKCIIWNYDIYGFDGGRTRQMADIIAANGKLHS